MRTSLRGAPVTEHPSFETAGFRPSPQGEEKGNLMTRAALQRRSMAAAAARLSSPIQLP